MNCLAPIHIVLRRRLKEIDDEEFTLMLERRSFFRTSLLMSLTATDSSCW